MVGASSAPLRLLGWGFRTSGRLAVVGSNRQATWGLSCMGRGLALFLVPSGRPCKLHGVCVGTLPARRIRRPSSGRGNPVKVAGGAGACSRQGACGCGFRQAQCRDGLRAEAGMNGRGGAGRHWQRHSGIPTTLPNPAATERPSMQQHTGPSSRPPAQPRPPGIQPSPQRAGDRQPPAKASSSSIEDKTKSSRDES